MLAAPLTDAAVTPYRAIKRSQRVVGPGSVVTVIGIGGLGHLAVQILRAVTPSTVIAVDSRPDALTHATSSVPTTRCRPETERLRRSRI